MKDSQPSLILYIIASMIVFIAKVTGHEVMMLVAKPMVIPAIYYFYLQTKTRNTDVLFTIAVWAFFVADMIMLLYPQTGIAGVMSFGMIGYLFLIRFAIRDLGRIRFNMLNIGFLTLLLVLLSYILVSILNLQVEDINNNYYFYLAYGIVLIILVSVSAFNYLSYSNTVFLYLCLMSICILVSDLFYCMNKFMIELPVLDHINLLLQLMSYFFMVKYFNMRKPLVVKE